MSLSIHNPDLSCKKNVSFEKQFQFPAAGFNGGPSAHRGEVAGNRTSIGATLKNMFMGSITSRRNQGGPGGGSS
jgi:hypothetical protein